MLTTPNTRVVDQRVCRDLVAHDLPGRNPFRELIPLAYHHSFLLYILIATSALHRSNMDRFRSTSATTAAQGGHGSSSSDSVKQPGTNEADADDWSASWGRMPPPVIPKQPRARRAWFDAMEAKHTATKLFRVALAELSSASSSICAVGSCGDGLRGTSPRNRPVNPSSISSEAILGAMLFFINFELIDLGKNEGASSWRMHLENFGKVISQLRPAMQHADAFGSGGRDQALRDYVLSDCLM